MSCSICLSDSFYLVHCSPDSKKTVSTNLVIEAVTLSLPDTVSKGFKSPREDYWIGYIVGSKLLWRSGLSALNWCRVQGRHAGDISNGHRDFLESTVQPDAVLFLYFCWTPWKNGGLE